MGGKLLALLGGGCVLAVLVVLQHDELVRMASRAALGGADRARAENEALSDVAAAPGRRGLPGRVPAPSQALPRDIPIPTDERELAEYVAWMRSLDPDELLRLSNAEFDFKKSELVQRLQELSGPWVLPALGDLAVAEKDPLLRAILVEGLVGSLRDERLDDERLLPILDDLMTQMRVASEDPFGVASGLVTAASLSCRTGHGDFVSLMKDHLAVSDNGAFLVHGYLFMSQADGGEGIVKETLSTHPSAEGRLGALEGLRKATLMGKVAPEELSALGLTALSSETSERNRLLLYEMLVAAGGETGLGAVEEIARSGDVAEVASTVGFLAQEMEPTRALALLQDVLTRPDLDLEARQAVYSALGALPDEEGADRLLEVVHDGERSDEERLAGLRGLWNRPVDERLAGELEDVLDGAGDPSMRIEALRMLTYGESEAADVDLRSLAALDRDAAVRAEAVQLAAMRPGEDTRAWLEERLMSDDSLDVKAAALGALVYHAHYGGDGDAVLGYLERARDFTEDEGALAMIAEGERMVKDYDPRRVELELAEDVRLYETLARYTDGAAQRDFQRQARLLGGMVSTVRAAQH